MEPIVYVDASQIVGDVDEVKGLMKGLTDFVETNEPQLLSYGFYLDETRDMMTVVAVHPDNASLELHMRVGGPEFRKFQGLINLVSIDVYGPVSDALLAKLEEKAKMLGTGTVTAHAPYAAYARFTDTTPDA